jgi:hypothetical protein
MRTPASWRLFTVIALISVSATSAGAQQAEPPTREAAIEQEQGEKAKSLHPYIPSKTEKLLNRADDLLVTGLRFHPFFESAYSGGGFTLGAGYAQHIGTFNFIDVRGSYTVTNYKRIEAEFKAPRLFNRRGELSVLGGWREATEVGFYGIGNDTSVDDKTNYLFRQPYGSAHLKLFPTRRYLMLGGGVELSEWSQRHGEGTVPSVETVYTPATLPGLGATVRYLHSQGTAGFDWRTTPGYTRRGGYYAVTFHDYSDNDKEFGFQQVDYEAIQHLPILREAWVISLRALAHTAYSKSDQQIPFFMLPSAGGGSSLRGFSSWRFRDKNSLVMQAEWRIMVNRFMDTAVFYDTGKVAARSSDLDFNGLKNDYGFGVRFHTPISTPLRVEVARSNEGVSFVFSANAVF